MFPPASPRGTHSSQQPPSAAGRRVIDTRAGQPPAFSGDENTWRDGSFKLRSCVSVMDLQLGKMMEEAELAAHAHVRQPSVLVNQDMDAQLRYLLAMLTSGTALQINPTRAKQCASRARRCQNVRSPFASTFLGTASSAWAIRSWLRARWCH